MPSSDQQVYARGHHVLEKNICHCRGPTRTYRGCGTTDLYAHRGLLVGDSRTFNLVFGITKAAELTICIVPIFKFRNDALSLIGCLSGRI